VPRGTAAAPPASYSACPLTRTASKPDHISQPRHPESGGKMELLIGFVTTLFISLLIFRT